MLLLFSYLLLYNVSPLPSSASPLPLLLFLPFSSPLALHACLITPEDPEALHSSLSTGGRQLKGEMHYENAELYDNMPSPKLASRYPPKPSSSPASSSSKSAGHYKTPVSKVSSKLLPADTKSKATGQVTNTLLHHTNLFCFHSYLLVLTFLKF